MNAKKMYLNLLSLLFDILPHKKVQKLNYILFLAINMFINTNSNNNISIFDSFFAFKCYMCN